MYAAPPRPETTRTVFFAPSWHVVIPILGQTNGNKDDLGFEVRLSESEGFRSFDAKTEKEGGTS